MEKLVRLDEPAAKIVVAQPDTAKLVATTDRSFYVRGVEHGSTNLLVYGPEANGAFGAPVKSTV